MQRRLPILPLLRSRTVLTEQLCNSACISCHTCARISFPDSAYGSRENSPTTNLTSGLSTDTESSEVGEPPVTSSPAPQHSPKFCVEPRTPINFNNDEPSYQTLDNSTPLDGDFSKLSCYGAIGDGQPRAQIPEMATAAYVNELVYTESNSFPAGMDICPTGNGPLYRNQLQKKTASHAYRLSWFKDVAHIWYRHESVQRASWGFRG